MINEVILIGNLGKDPEIRSTQSGKMVAKFSIATQEGSGENKRTEWHNIACWEKLAEIAQKYLSKGKLIYVHGRLQTQQWEKDGQTHYRTEIVADRIRMLEKAPEGAGREQANANTKRAVEQPDVDW